MTFIFIDVYQSVVFFVVVVNYLCLSLDNSSLEVFLWIFSCLGTQIRVTGKKGAFCLRATARVPGPHGPASIPGSTAS